MKMDNTFNCSGKINSNDWQLNRSSFFLRGEVENAIYPSKEYPFSSSEVRLFDGILPASTAILDLKHLTECAEMKLKILSRHEVLSSHPKKQDPTNYYLIRSSVSEFILYVRSYLYSIKWLGNSVRNIESAIGKDLDELFLAIKSFLGRLRVFPDPIFHYTASNLGNKCIQPEFHMYHMHLDLRWMYITLLHARDITWSHVVESHSGDTDTQMSMPQLNPDLDNAISLVIDDLIYVSTKLFERVTLADIRSKSPFSCTCVRELWLMLQIVVDDLASKANCKRFWDYVNLSIDTIIGVNKQKPEYKSWNNFSKRKFLECKNPEMFCIWLIYHTALLYGYNIEGVYMGSISARIKSNSEQVEKVLRSFVNNGGKAGDRDDIDEELRVMIPLITTLICDWWEPSAEIISNLWDCFHRRLNQPFLLQTSGPWALTLHKKGPTEILKQIGDRLEGNSEQSKESSYGMFLRLLGAFLQNNARCWKQFKGRVYSKFTERKVKDYSEAGLYNFISLFLTLATIVETNNVCNFMLELLPSLPASNEEHKRRSIVWKGQLAVLILFAKQKLNFEKVSEKIMKEVNVTSCSKDDCSRAMMTDFVDVLNIILISSENMDLSEHRFIGGWVDRYSIECPKNRIKPLLTILVKVFKKCNQIQEAGPSGTEGKTGSSLMLEALWTNVAHRVRTLVFEPQITNEHHQILSELAVCFTLQAHRDPGAASRHKHSFITLFRHFTVSPMIKDARIIRSYLTLILKEELAVQELRKKYEEIDVIVIQGWIKCCILGEDSECPEMKCLTGYVLRLDQIRQIFPSHSQLLAIENNKQPIIQFLLTFLKTHTELQTKQERDALGVKCRLYFNNLDKWVLGPITEETKDSELAQWIYRCIGTLVLCCSPMMYFKNQPNNMLMNLINKAILPSDKTGPVYVTNLGKRIFSTIILGIGTLDFKCDMTLRMLIKNLFDLYLPMLVTEKTGSYEISHSLQKCFSDASPDFLRLILEILAANFIVFRDNTTYKHCYLVSLLLKHLLKNADYAGHVPEVVVSVCLPNVLVCYLRVNDLHPHKKQTVDLVSALTSNPHYKNFPPIRAQLKLVLNNGTQRWMTISPKSFLEFISALAKFDVGVVQSILPNIERSIADSEANRRHNAGSLRYSFNQLQKSLQLPERKS